MSATPKKIEASLVSMASVLARVGQLRSVTGYTEDFSVPKTIEGQLLTAGPTLRRIVNDVQLAHQQISQDAQELLADWAENVGFRKGGLIFFEAGDYTKISVQVRAFVKELKLDEDCTIGGVKQVCVTLEGVTVTLPDGSFLSEPDESKGNLLSKAYTRASPVLSVAYKQLPSGIFADPVYTLSIPVKQSDRLQLEAEGYLKFL